MKSRLFCALLALSLCALPAPAQIAVRGARVHTMAGPLLEPGLVLIENGRIRAVGSPSSLVVPEGWQQIEAAVVVPGLIDARSVVGLAGWLNYGHDQEVLELGAPLQPELRAYDAYDAREPLVGWLRSLGVTSMHTGPAPLALIGGQSVIVKLRGETVEQAVLVPTAMVCVTLGEGNQNGGKDAPGTRSKGMALLRAELIKAGEYRDQLLLEDLSKRPARDLGLEALVEVLAKRRPLLVSANRARDIDSALRLAQEFGLELVLDGAAEAYLRLDALRAAKVPVLLHATMARAEGERENLSQTTAKLLIEAGIPTAIQSGYEAYVPKTRVVLFEAAIAAKQGLSFEQALGTITIEAARILGLDQRIGSLETGKDADLALYDGDPFEYSTHCIGVLIDGQIVSTEVR